MRRICNLLVVVVIVLIGGGLLGLYLISRSKHEHTEA